MAWILFIIILAIGLINLAITRGLVRGDNPTRPRSSLKRKELER